MFKIFIITIFSYESIFASEELKISDVIPDRLAEYKQNYKWNFCANINNTRDKRYVRRHILEGLLLSTHTGNQHWDEYKSVYNKSYMSEPRENTAKVTWLDNLNMIAEHNRQYMKGLHNYTLHLNHFADMSTLQFRQRVVKLYERDTNVYERNNLISNNHDQSLPKSFDWREKGFRPRMEEQWRCGACYAFTVAHTVQGQMFHKHRIWRELSVQQIVDCSTVEGNLGCGGGSLGATFKYITKYGLEGELEYPYIGKSSKCRYNSLLVRARGMKWSILPSNNEKMVEHALVNIGPLAIAINASPSTFQLYRSGVYYDPECSDDLNHAMLLIGYTSDYWIIMNWWGVNWGENGFMRIKRGHNTCGITNIVGYIELL